MGLVTIDHSGIPQTLRESFSNLTEGQAAESLIQDPRHAGQSVGLYLTREIDVDRAYEATTDRQRDAPRDIRQ